MVGTWLYIKKHNQTGLLYFGKTVRNPLKYKGSGSYWSDHRKIHGNDVSTIWFELFEDADSLTEFAEFFSEFFEIVTITNNGKKVWANEVPENGLLGGQNKGIPGPLKGIPQPHVSKALKGRKRPEHSKIMSGRKQTAEHSANISKALTGKTRTNTHSENISKAKKGKNNPLVSTALKGRVALNKGKKLKTYSCKHCGIFTTGGNLKRWHNDNCKLKGNKK